MNRKLGIAHVVDSLEIGGLERVVTDLAIAQASFGHRVTVFSINSTQGFRSTLEAHGVPVVVGEKQTALDTQVLSRLRAVARTVDVVHAHNFVPNYYSAIAMLAMVRRPVLVSTCHDMGTRLANRKLRWLYRLSLTRTARVAMVGKQVHDHFVRSGLVPECRAMTVLNGIPVDRFRNSPERRASARRSLGIDLDTPIVGCVGRLVALKNHGVLIAAFRRLLPKFPTLKLVLVGDGPLANELQALTVKLGVTDRVHFLGAHPAVADLLPAFDVFALPSKTEGLSIALLEACATGLAVVATAVGGNPDIIADGKTGVLVPVDDEAALACALDHLLSTPSERERIGTAASQWVETHASADSLRIAYDVFYSSARSTCARVESAR